MLLASFLVGAIILVVEIMGTRVISPYYGASIYVWSSLIGVTLASLSAGYVLGGWAADRWPRLPGLALEMIGGALCLLLLPWMQRGVLAAATPLGLKAGAPVSGALLFAPPLGLLGMTGPVAIRLVTSEVTLLGRGVGKIRYTNIFLVASREPLPAPAALANGEALDFHGAPGGRPPAGGPAYVLTDDYNPIDDLQRPFLVALREDLIRKEQSVLLFDGTLGQPVNGGPPRWAPIRRA